MPFIDPGDEYANEPRLVDPGECEPWNGEVELQDGFLSFRGLTLRDPVDLDGCDELELIDCVVDGVSLVGAQQVTAHGSRFVNADLSQVQFVSVRATAFEGCKMVGVDLAGGAMKDALISSSAMRYCNFRLATFERVSIEGGQLDQVDFYGSQLSHVGFDDCKLVQVNVDQCRFDHVDLRGAIEVDLVAASDLAGVLIADHQVMQLAYHFALAAGVGIERTEDDV